MNTDLKSFKILSLSQYADIGKTVHLLSAIEYELFRTFSAAVGATEVDSVNTAAKGTFKHRLGLLKKRLVDNQHIRSEQLQETFKKLETASELRDQFFHGLWMMHKEQLTCKFIKRHNGADGSQSVAIQEIAMPPQKFKLIHRNLEYILTELSVFQEILNDANSK
jgi:hypothetical protein